MTNNQFYLDLVRKRDSRAGLLVPEMEPLDVLGLHQHKVNAVSLDGIAFLKGRGRQETTITMAAHRAEAFMTHFTHDRRTTNTLLCREGCSSLNPGKRDPPFSGS